MDSLDVGAPWAVSSAGWMEVYSHVLSTSLINARKAGAFNSNGGVILSAASRVLCAYPYDGGAMNYPNGCGMERPKPARTHQAHRRRVHLS